MKRLVSARAPISNQQSSFATTQINLIPSGGGNRAGSSITAGAGINHTTTVRDVVSNRMRNKIVGDGADSIIFQNFNNLIVNPSSSSTINNYWVSVNFKLIE